jgi:hypothetical protein
MTAHREDRARSAQMSASVGPILLRYVDEHTWTIYVVLTSRRERTRQMSAFPGVVS